MDCGKHTQAIMLPFESLPFYRKVDPAEHVEALHASRYFFSTASRRGKADASAPTKEETVSASCLNPHCN